MAPISAERLILSTKISFSFFVFFFVSSQENCVLSSTAILTRLSVGSETFSSELGPRLSEPHDNQESMRRCGIIQSYDNVGDYLLKAVESINKAYSAVGLRLTLLGP